MNVLIMSDIHGNLEALRRMLGKAEEHDIHGCIILGDLIDYGMRSNEVLRCLQNLKYPILCNIWGNHEQSVSNGNYERFSSDRGRVSAENTRRCMDENAWRYLECMESLGEKEFMCGGKKCLAIHGSAEDVYWKSITPEQELSQYSQYDYVFSGHSHRPHFFEKYYDAEDPKRRNKKKTIFINPGSVGQPRNLNPMAQAVLLNLETEEVSFLKISYDVAKEQNYFTEKVDSFYRERLEYGV